jgi:hypothetical protein
MQTVNSDAATPQIDELLVVVGITNATILNYFEAFSAGDYEATSQQFAIDATLHPPFESPIVGRDAIEHYLKAEAKGITAQPQQETIGQILEDGCTEIQVTGRVKTPWFGVGVSWLFTLNDRQEIVFLKLKLIASPQELLKLRR